MKAANVTLAVLETAAKECGVVLDTSSQGKQYRVKVNPGKPNRYQRINAISGRKINAVCWHGFRDFFRAVYRINPQAKFVTAFDTWQDSADFEARFKETGYKNIGSQMYPATAAESCTCPESGCV